MVVIVDNFAEKLPTHLFLFHCAVFQDPAVLQAISAQQHEPQIADAATSTVAATDILPAPQSQVTGFNHYVSIAILCHLFDFAVLSNSVDLKLSAMYCLNSQSHQM